MLCFNIRVLDFTCIHRPKPSLLPAAPPLGRVRISPRNVAPPDSSRPLTPGSTAPSFLLFRPVSISLSLFPQNYASIRPLFSATPPNRVLFNWWDVCAFPCTYKHAHRRPQAFFLLPFSLPTARACVRFLPSLSTPPSRVFFSRCFSTAARILGIARSFVRVAGRVCFAGEH